MSDSTKIIEHSHDIPQGSPTIEAQFRTETGELDYLKAQRVLQELQAKGPSITAEEIRAAISIIRLLRRGYTGPAATKRKPSAKAERGKATLSIEDMLK